MKSIISREKAINDIREIFYIGENRSAENNGRFIISKLDYERFDVMMKLCEYFSDKVLEKDYKCVVSPITMLYTIFEIRKL